MQFNCIEMYWGYCKRSECDYTFLKFWFGLFPKAVQSKLVEIPMLNRVEDYPGWQIQATHALKALKIWVYVSGKILELRGNKIPTAQQAMDDYLNEDR
jgi:hypothetical protein